MLLVRGGIRKIVCDVCAVGRIIKKRNRSVVLRRNVKGDRVIEFRKGREQLIWPLFNLYIKFMSDTLRRNNKVLIYSL